MYNILIEQFLTTSTYEGSPFIPLLSIMKIQKVGALKVKNYRSLKVDIRIPLEPILEELIPVDTISSGDGTSNLKGAVKIKIHNVLINVRESILFSMTS